MTPGTGVPPESLRAFPQGGRRLWPGQARSTASAEVACSAAFGVSLLRGSLERKWCAGSAYRLNVNLLLF